MGFVNVLLRGISMIPVLIQGVENLFGAKSGNEKRNSVLGFVGLSLGLAEKIAAKDIVDENAFNEGLKQIVDGTVKCLNASVWYKK